MVCLDSKKHTRLIFLVLMVLLSGNLYSQGEFITTWQTDNTGTSGDTEITIPTNSSYTYNYDVDWDNDGVFDETGLTGSVTHDFGVAGTGTIRIQGIFPTIFFNNSGDAEKL
ncbi:MAG: hypothetical protein MI922_02805, partial [Bacteroidales bacterium]|nr:hypothetical protein [Bacteroidales bacterium]